MHAYQYVYDNIQERFIAESKVDHKLSWTVTGLRFSNDGTVLAISSTNGVWLVRTKVLLEGEAIVYCVCILSFIRNKNANFSILVTVLI